MPRARSALHRLNALLLRDGPSIPARSAAGLPPPGIGVAVSKVASAAAARSAVFAPLTSPLSTSLARPASRFSGGATFVQHAGRPAGPAGLAGRLARRR